MAKIHINNPKQVINGGAKKYYFKVKGLGGPKGDKGDKGDTGATGPQGPQGNAATVSVGSTTTLPVGQDATVQNVGTLYNAVLNFGIPQGPRGPQGATGATGAKGDKGDQGNPGPQGEKGTNATVYVGTTSTLNPGSQATVYNSGTDSNAVLNFGIPKGEKGDTGPMPTIAQTTGQAIDQVMSQKATTDALNTKQATITNSSKLSADLVTDTSTTNKFVTASDITNWNAKQDALTAGTGIDITGGVISTPAIVPEVVTELPTTGAEGKLYLTPKAHTTSTATGNPITATITAQAGQLESFRLDGDTFQQSYEGKNLLKLNDATITLGGVPITTTNGTVNLKGTATSSAQGYYVTIDMTASEPMVFSPNRSGTTIGLDIKLQYKRGETVYYPSVGNYLSLQAGDIIQQMYLIVSNGSVLDGSFSPMLEVGSTSTSYEPFVGGQPSPSPSYPQQIQTVTGEQTVEIVGKNIIDTTILQNAWDNNNGVSIIYSQQYVRTVEYTPVDASTTYTLSYLVRGGVVMRGNILQYDSNKSFISSISIADNITFTTAGSTAFVRFNLYHPDNLVPNDITNLQLELGSTATAYEPYSSNDYEINLGKNLYNGSIYKTDYILGATGNEVYSVNGVITEQIKIEPNTVYTASAIWNSAEGDAYIRIGVYDASMGWIVRYSGQLNKITFTTPANARYIRLSYYRNRTDSVQLELGSTATTYAPYFTPIELCKLGTYQDYIYKDGDSWKVHKATATITLTGASSENWYIDQYAYMLNNVISAKAFSDIANMEAYCRSFSKSATGQTSSYAVSFWYNATGTGVRFIKDQTPDLSSYRNWLASNNQTVYYPLATSTDTTITDQTLIAQLEAIRTASLENGTNTITNTATGTNLAGDMEIGYYGFNPINRYDKFIWLDLNNNYEQIGGE